MFLLAVAVTAVVGMSTGAPSSACSEITPSHYGSVASTNPVPYNVNISNLNDGYIPGQAYTSEYVAINN